MNLIAQRTVDDLCRIVIPLEIREKLDVREKDIMDVYIKDDSVILKKNTSVPHCSV